MLSRASWPLHVSCAPPAALETAPSATEEATQASKASWQLDESRVGVLDELPAAEAAEPTWLEEMSHRMSAVSTRLSMLSFRVDSDEGAAVTTDAGAAAPSTPPIAEIAEAEQAEDEELKQWDSRTAAELAA